MEWIAQYYQAIIQSFFSNTSLNASKNPIVHSVQHIRNVAFLLVLFLNFLKKTKVFYQYLLFLNFGATFNTSQFVAYFGNNFVVRQIVLCVQGKTQVQAKTKFMAKLGFLSHSNLIFAHHKIYKNQQKTKKCRFFFFLFTFLTLLQDKGFRKEEFLKFDLNFPEILLSFRKPLLGKNLQKPEFTRKNSRVLPKFG